MGTDNDEIGEDLDDREMPDESDLAGQDEPFLCWNCGKEVQEEAIRCPNCNMIVQLFDARAHAFWRGVKVFFIILFLSLVALIVSVLLK